MWAAGAPLLATADRLLTEMDLGVVLPRQGAGPMQLGPGQDEETAQVVLVEIFHRIEQIAVEGHQ
jgi:hypothetical protein